MSLEFVLYHCAQLGIALLLVQSLNVLWRAGLFSFGNHGFAAIGAYAAVIVLRLLVEGRSNWDLPHNGVRVAGHGVFLLSVIVGVLVAGLAGGLLGRLLRKLRDDYFAVATLVFAEIMQGIFSNWSYVGGPMGYEARYLFFANDKIEGLAYCGSFAALLTLLNALLYRGIAKAERWLAGGWVLAVESNEQAARATGIDVDRVRMGVLAVGAGIAGGAGAIVLHLNSMILPSDFSFANSLPVLVYVVLGGLRPRRCIVATIIVYIVYEFLKLRAGGLLGATVGAFVFQWRDVLLAAVLILAVVVPALVRRRLASVGARA